MHAISFYRLRLSVLCLTVACLTPGAVARAGPVPPLASVARAADGEGITLADGTYVLLASIDVPQEMTGAAQARLTSLLSGRQVRIAPVMAERDRHDRVVAQVARDDGLWIQADLINSGLASVRLHAGDVHDAVTALIGVETRARKARLGLWALPAHRVLAPAETAASVGQYRLVEGTVISAHDYHGGLYLNFSEHWKGQFSGYIPLADRALFDAATLSDIAGHKVVLRGWIEDHHGPGITLARPEQLEAGF